MRTIFVRNLFLVAAFLLCGNLAFSQGGYVFRVLANKGANQVKRATGTTEGLKTGATLKAGDQIIAGNGAYIGLMHKTGKTLEIRQQGVIKVNDLEKKVAAIKTSVTSRYAQYVMNKINEDEGGVRRNYRNSMNATGATDRGSSGDIILRLPVDKNKIEVYNPNILIRWKEVETIESYVVTVSNIFNEELFRTETSESKITLDLSTEEMTNESSLYILKIVDAKDKDFDSPEIAISKIDPVERPELKSEIEALKAEVDMTTPIGQLLMATFYDEKELVLDALTVYEQLVRENPDVQDFQDLYAEFLAKNNIVTKESTATEEDSE